MAELGEKSALDLIQRKSIPHLPTPFESTRVPLLANAASRISEGINLAREKVKWLSGHGHIARKSSVLQLDVEKAAAEEFEKNWERHLASSDYASAITDKPLLDDCENEDEGESKNQLPLLPPPSSYGRDTRRDCVVYADAFKFEHLVRLYGNNDDSASDDSFTTADETPTLRRVHSFSSLIAEAETIPPPSPYRLGTSRRSGCVFPEAFAYRHLLRLYG
ncbi:hypothetical protein AJ80_00759 [Polytolypa hystricis UAMH7299]|uniref:Uncharacterized protein n=1 Tax=Polytolypa hystricis (strain UAMH7299) TaxID=1447883 RepID=A0A2B7Z316_POLH7|nr:hypothetical protein AJ80_00759 [Polytolypa hystricis UAMH7299]